MDDRYLIVRQLHRITILQTESGDIVFDQDYEAETTTGSALYTLDEKKKELFLMGQEGLCLDTEQWEIKMEIPYLAGVADQWIITEDPVEKRYCRYPRYRVADYVRQGIAAL